VLTCKSDCSGFDTTQCCPAGKELCDGACVTLGTDNLNCGKCDHDCGGDICSLGKCEAKTMASGQSGPVGVAVDSTTLYWTNYGIGPNLTGTSVRSVPKTSPGASASTLDTSGIAARDITIDPLTGDVLWGYVYPAASIRRLNVSTKTVSTVVAGSGGIFFYSGPTTDGNTIFHATVKSDGSALTLVQTDMAGAEISTMALPAGVNAFTAQDANNVYWTATNAAAGQGGIWKASKANISDAVRINTTDNTYAIDAREGALCFSTGSSGGPGTVFASDTNGNATALAIQQDDISATRIDGGYCYWTGGDNNTPGYVRRRKLDLSTPIETLATTPNTPFGGIALDEKFVYFSDSGNGLLRRVHR
jgi:hypothetical protein